MSLPSKGLRFKTLSQAAAAEIRTRILSGVYAPGFALRQDFLAGEFGMSRIPIREALMSLEADGFVKILPHRGALVITLTIEEIEELFNMRVLLEPFLMLRSGPNLTESDFVQIRDILYKYSESLEKPDASRWNDINSEFHMALYKHAASPRMLASVQGLLAECDRHTRIHISKIEGARERAIAEHQELLRLCEQGNFLTAAALTKEHIERIGQSLVALLRS